MKNISEKIVEAKEELAKFGATIGLNTDELAAAQSNLASAAQEASLSIKELAAKMHEQKEKLRKDLKKDGIYISKRALKRGLKRLHEVEPASSLGRNDPCPCGSGKKYKKCCLK